MSAINGLDDACPACNEVCGDHTLRQWSACMGTLAHTTPYQPQEPDVAALADRTMRERFGLEEDWLVADNVILRAATLDAESGVLGVRVPALIHEFSSSNPDPSQPRTVAKVVFIGSLDSMRGYGRLARDSANGAANAAETRRAA